MGMRRCLELCWPMQVLLCGGHCSEPGADSEPSCHGVSLASQPSGTHLSDWA